MEDEADVLSNYQHGRNCVPKGKTSVIRLSTKCIPINMPPVITNKGKVYFQSCDDQMNAYLLAVFLRRFFQKCQKESDFYTA